MTAPSEPALAVEQVSRRYGELLAVDGVEFTVPPGEVLALLGPNGAGKTSLLTMIAGLAEPDSGAIAIEGERGTARRRLRVGYCPQTPLLWPDLTPREQLDLLGELYGLSKSERRTRSDALLSALLLEEKADRLAHTLSGGTQRRLNLALAMIHHPPVLVLDEPTANLDLESRRRVHALIHQACRTRRTAVLLSTHDADDAERLADRVLVMDRGRVLALDTPAALKNRAGSAATIEVTFSEVDPELILRAERAVSGLVASSRWADRTLFLEVASVASHLGKVGSAFEAGGLAPREIKSRATSLEDAIREVVIGKAKLERPDPPPGPAPSSTRVPAPSTGRER